MLREKARERERESKKMYDTALNIIREREREKEKC